MVSSAKSMFQVYPNPDLRFISASVDFLRRNSAPSVRINGESFQRADVENWIKKSVIKFIPDEITGKQALNYLDGLEGLHLLDGVDELILKINTGKGFGEQESIETNEEDKRALQEVIAENEKAIEDDRAKTRSDSRELKYKTAGELTIEEQMEMIRKRQAEIKEIIGFEIAETKAIEKRIYDSVKRDPHYNIGKEPSTKVDGQSKIFKQIIEEKTREVIAIAGRRVAAGEALTKADLQKILVNSQASQLLNRDGLKILLDEAERLTTTDKNKLIEYHNAKIKNIPSFERLVSLYEDTYGLSRQEAIKAASGAEQALISGDSPAEAYIKGFRQTGRSYETAKEMIINENSFESYDEAIKILGERANYNQGVYVDGKRLIIDSFQTADGEVRFEKILENLNRSLDGTGKDMVGASDLQRIMMNNYDGLDSERASTLQSYRKGFIEYKGGNYSDLFSEQRIDFSQINSSSWRNTSGISYRFESRPPMSQRFMSRMSNWGMSSSNFKSSVGNGLSGIGRAMGFKMPSLDIGAGLLENEGVDKLANLLPAVGAANFVRKHWKKLGAGILGGLAAIAAWATKGAWALGGAIGGGIGGAILGAKAGAVIGTAIAGPVGGAIGAIIGGVVGFLGGAVGGGWVGLKIGELFGSGKAAVGAEGLSTGIGAGIAEGGMSVAASASTAIYTAIGATAIGGIFMMSTLNSAFYLPPFDQYGEYLNNNGEFSCDYIPEGFPSGIPIDREISKSDISQWENGTFSHSGSNAIDIPGTTNDSILATFPGTVTMSCDQGDCDAAYYDYGNLVVVSGEAMMDGVKREYKVIYAHLSSRSVAKDKSISKGEKIGNMGSTGYSTDTHLHYEIMKSSDPLVWATKISCNLFN